MEHFHSTYFGCNIYWRTTNGGLTGSRMRWATYIDSATGRFRYADTLAGIKQTIREATGKSRKTK